MFFLLYLIGGPMESSNTVRISLDRNTIGYIVRAKRDENHSPSIRSQHADCIRPYGELIGFSMRGGPATGGELCRSWNLIDMNHQGTTFDIADLINLSKKGPNATVRDSALKMISAEHAQKQDFMSAVLIIHMSSEKTSMRFIEAWEKLKTSQKSFNIVGGNCAVRAYHTFVEAGIIEKNRTILTPNQLFQYLADELETKEGYTLKKYFGYIGFEKNIKVGYDLIINF